MGIQNVRRCHSLGEILSATVAQIITRSQHIPAGDEALDGDMTIAAIPTWYAETTFRSKLEADWAATLDSLAIRWEYEPQTLTLPSGTVYIPDFWLPEIGTWLEVKGTGVPRVEKAIELGESRACYCEADCTCEWSGGELVIIGHPPEPAGPEWRGRRIGHPKWSSAYGRSALLGRCDACGRVCWFTRPWCRACDRRLHGEAYQSGTTELEFVTSRGLPAPVRGDAA